MSSGRFNSCEDFQDLVSDLSANDLSFSDYGDRSAVAPGGTFCHIGIKLHPKNLQTLASRVTLESRIAIVNPQSRSLVQLSMSLTENSLGGSTVGTTLGPAGSLHPVVVKILEDAEKGGAINNLDRSAIHKDSWSLLRIYDSKKVDSLEPSPIASASSALTQEKQEARRKVERLWGEREMTELARGANAMRGQLNELTLSDTEQHYFDSGFKGSRSQRREAEDRLNDIAGILKSTKLNILARHGDLLAKAGLLREDRELMIKGNTSD